MHPSVDSPPSHSDYHLPYCSVGDGITQTSTSPQQHTTKTSKKPVHATFLVIFVILVIFGLLCHLMPSFATSAELLVLLHSEMCQ
jgi:hypothetical protein